MAEDTEKKKKKPTLGERMRAAIMRGTGADKVVAGFDTSKTGPTPAEKADPMNQTQGIFDEGKYERNRQKKKK